MKLCLLLASHPDMGKVGTPDKVDKAEGLRGKPHDNTLLDMGSQLQWHRQRVHNRFQPPTPP